MRINFIVAVFNEFLLFALCHILMESFLKKSKRYDIVHIECVWCVWMKKRRNVTSYQKSWQWNSATIAEQRVWVRIAILKWNRTRQCKTHMYVVYKLMSWHIVAVTYNFQYTIINGNVSNHIQMCAVVCVCVHWMWKIFIVFHKLNWNHLLL